MPLVAGTPVFLPRSVRMLDFELKSVGAFRAILSTRFGERYKKIASTRCAWSNRLPGQAQDASDVPHNFGRASCNRCFHRG